MVTVVYVLLPTSVWADLGLYSGIAGLTVVAILVGVWLHRPAPVAGWLMFAAGNLLYFLGEVSWSYLDATGQDPFPSFADYFYLSGYAVLVLGLLLLVRRHSPVRDLFGGLDAAILALAAGVLSWVYLMEPYASDVEYGLSDTVWTLAYPLMDLVLLAVAVRLVLALRVRTWSIGLLLMWPVLEIGADVVYGWQQLQGTYSPGGLVDATWMISYAMAGAAALHPSAANKPETMSGGGIRVGLTRLVVLGLAALVAPIVLISHQLSADHASSTELVPAVATTVMFVLVVARMAGLIATVRRLTQRQGQERFEAMVEHSADVIAIVDSEHRITYVSPAVRSMYGLRPAECIGRPISELVASDDQSSFLSHLTHVSLVEEGATTTTSAEFVRVDGSRGTFEAVAANLSRAADGVVITISDVTRHAELQRQLSHQAFHDSLTALPNRALFIDRVEHSLARHERSGPNQVAVLFLDVDDFKSINDGLGHSAGDELLVSIGQRLRTCMRPGDTIARLGGDEFAVLIDGDAALPECVSIAERILEILRLPLSVQDYDLSVQASIGIAIAHPDSTPHSLLRDADIAMYEAKDTGKGRYGVFDPEMREAATELLALRTDLSRALERGELRLVYQPIVQLASEQISGAEALLRWEHPKHGNIGPDQFIPIAEQSGLILPIGRWVLEQACVEAATWQTQSHRPTISVNASGVQFRDRTLVDDITRALAISGLDPSLLTIEITETVLMDDTEKAKAILEAVSDLGVRLAIDDFGTGYCSLAYIRNFPVDIIKIDRAFVSELAEPTTQGGLAENILAMTDNLQLPTVAEGIEEQAQAERLRTLNCQYGQGFHFARPLERDGLVDLLRTRRPIPVTK